MAGKSWEKIYREKGPSYHTSLEPLEHITALFRKEGVKKVLDLGCGAGKHATFLAEEGFEVYGLDISREAIAVAEKHTAGKNTECVFNIGSFYEKLPHKTDFFDAVLSLRAMHHGRENDIKKLISELERILKPGGMLYITVPKVDLQKKPETKIEQLGLREFVNIDGEEKGVIHFIYDKDIIRDHFRNFEISLDSPGREYIVSGRLKPDR